MADERVPFKWGKWVKRNPNPVARGAEYGTPVPLVRGIRSRIKKLREDVLGPTDEELAQWQNQVQRMQEAGFAWSQDKNMWQRGEQFVEPWGAPGKQTKAQAQPEVDIAAQAQEQGLEDMGKGYWQDTKGNLYWWDKDKQRFLKQL